MKFWTPITFRFETTHEIRWADLRAYRFDQPFLKQRLARLIDDGDLETRWTGLSELAALDCAPSLEPALIIAHPTRSGSTLLALEMAALPGSILLNEPALGALCAHAIGRPEFPLASVLRQFVRALGRIRFGDERRVVLKLSSSYARFLPAFRLAFPGVPIVWVQRRPEEIVESQMRAPSNWIGGDRSNPEALARAVLHKISMLFMAASQHVDSDTLVLDYRDLPEAAWTTVARRSGLTLTRPEIETMRSVADTDAHSGAPFAVRDKVPLPSEVLAIVRRDIDPLYEALRRRGLARAA